MVRTRIRRLCLAQFMCLFVVLNTIVSRVYADSPPLIDDNCIGIPAAFGDFDSDKLTDVFVIDSDGKSFSMLRGFSHEPLLRPEKKWHCDLKKNKDSEVGYSLNIVVTIIIICCSRLHRPLSV